MILLVLIAGTIFTLFLVYMGVLNSLKTEGDMMNDILALPTHVQFGNYTDAYHKIDFLRSLWNTAAITATGVVGIILFASMAGYKLSRTTGKLSAFIPVNLGIFYFRAHMFVSRSHDTNA